MVACWSVSSCSRIRAVTLGWQCPQETVTMPAKRSRYRRPVSSKRYCIRPSTIISGSRYSVKTAGLVYCRLAASTSSRVGPVYGRGW